jgi:5-methyltetrahydrofolate--homocysteine methyltransferase
MLTAKPLIFADGASGTMIQQMCMARGIAFDVPERLNFTHPELIAEIVSAYRSAGSDLVFAHTFGANRYKLPADMNAAETVKKAIAVAKAADDDVLIGLDVGSLGKLLKPNGDLSFEDAYAAFAEIMIAGQDADFIVIETMTDLAENRAALLAAKENTRLPVICSMTFEANGKTFLGVTPQTAALTLSGLGADVIGVNCSLGPDALSRIADLLLEYGGGTPVMVKPNAGLPDPKTGRFALGVADFAAQMRQFAEKGVQILGGCCGTDPEYIARLKAETTDVIPNKAQYKRKSLLCSAVKTVEIDRGRIIGERINPTGKPKLKAALKNGDYTYIAKEAVTQAAAGADILDVNVGLPDIDEKSAMISAVAAVQSVTDLPLQIDSTKPEVIEAALRICHGKALVNSVNGDESSLDAILPIVKKYGAAVLGLTLDEQGVPKTAESRFAIARRIMDKALSYGIPKEDIYIDCLTLTAAAEQTAVSETLTALQMVKERLGLKTVLGVSNVSFGLPNRELLNSTFLSAALSQGLDLAILNPMSPVMTGAVRAYNVLSAKDANAEDYITEYSEQTTAVTVAANSNTADMTLEAAIGAGLTAEAVGITKKLLSSQAPLTIVNDILIPVLDKTGALFAAGKLYLTQLVSRAGCASACFDEVRAAIAKDPDSNSDSAEKGTILLATVKGDVHDIGKNIVKVILESYGYTVIDLGKDVPPQVVADSAAKHNIRLVGLSALMTTTLPAMAETIRLLKAQGGCKIMVGGAVLTADYAASIGADFYAKTAMDAIPAAKAVFG